MDVTVRTRSVCNLFDPAFHRPALSYWSRCINNPSSVSLVSTPPDSVCLRILSQFLCDPEIDILLRCSVDTNLPRSSPPWRHRSLPSVFRPCPHYSPARYSRDNRFHMSPFPCQSIAIDISNRHTITALNTYCFHLFSGVSFILYDFICLFPLEISSEN